VKAFRRNIEPRSAAVKETRFTVILCNFAAWMHSTVLEGLTGTRIGRLMEGALGSSLLKHLYTVGIESANKGFLLTKKYFLQVWLSCYLRFSLKFPAFRANLVTQVF
jgi:hypothetical protein